MKMKMIGGTLIIFFIVTLPVLAQERPSSNDIISKLQTELNLSQDQVYHITPIIEKYAIAYHDLQQSIGDGTINPSAIDSQRQGLEAAETQELSQYLKPYQLSEWRSMQGQMDQQKDKDNSDANVDADQYSNLPRDNPPSN